MEVKSTNQVLWESVERTQARERAQMKERIQTKINAITVKFISVPPTQQAQAVPLMQVVKNYQRAYIRYDQEVMEAYRVAHEAAKKANYTEPHPNFVSAPPNTTEMEMALKQLDLLCCARQTTE